MSRKNKRNYDEIAAVERAIAKKYGKETVQNPNANWDDEKEKEYIENTKKFQEKISMYNEDNDLTEIEGFLMPRKLINVESDRVCPICSLYSFDKADDYFMNKYECCNLCFVDWVEGREERWKSGWRPSKEKK